MSKHKGLKRFFTILLSVVALLFAAILVLRWTNENDVGVHIAGLEQIIITSDAFEEGQSIPIQYSGRGEDISPNFKLASISAGAKSIAIIMDDLDHPLFGTYNHWVIWNIPPQNSIPENIPHGAVVEPLGGAVQGNGFGRHRYRGPMPPFGTHRYRFNVYVLDTLLALDSDSGKAALVQSMEGHVLQYGSIVGTF